MKHAIALACVLATSTYSRPAAACSCQYPPPPVDVRLAEAASVFTGEVLSDTPGAGCNADHTLVRILIADMWKGEAATEVTVKNTRSSCRASLVAGERYLFFVYDGMFELSSCSVTPIDRAAEDIAALDATAE